MRWALMLLVAAAVVCSPAAAGDPAPYMPPTVIAPVVTLTWSAGTCETSYACFLCEQPIDLAELDVTVDTSTVHEDAVKLAAGCTGRIGTLNVTTMSADGVKVAEGAHDIEIQGGSVECLDKAPTLHQDGMQAMGGDAIHLADVTFGCGRPNTDLIDSNLLIKQAGASTRPPRDVTCYRCVFGPDAAHTINVQTSIDSGAIDSVVCPAKYPRLTFTIGPGAAGAVNVGNRFPAVCP